MKNIIKSIKDNPLHFYISIGASLSGLIGLIIYLCTGIIRNYTEAYSPWLIVILCLGIVINLFSACKKINGLETIPFVAYIISLILFFIVNANYLVSVVRAIDITSVSVSFVFTAVFLVIATVSSIVGVCIKPKTKETK